MTDERAREIAMSIQVPEKDIAVVVKEEVETFLCNFRCYLDTHYKEALDAKSGSMRKSINGYIRNNLPALLLEAVRVARARALREARAQGMEEAAKIADEHAAKWRGKSTAAYPFDDSVTYSRCGNVCDQVAHAIRQATGSQAGQGKEE